MKYLLIIITLILTACTTPQCEDPVQCLIAEDNGQSTSFMLVDTIVPGNYYYLSLKSEEQGILNMQFTSTGTIVYPDSLSCHIYYLFVTDTNKVSTVHKRIVDFYNGVDTNFIYYCSGEVTPCN